MFNPNLDFEALAKDYAVDKRLRIEDILDPAYAEELAQNLETGIEYATFLNANGQNSTITKSDFAQMSREDQSKLQQAMLTEAMQGQGFCYNGHKIGEGNNSVLRQFLSFLNSPETLEKMKLLTSDPEVKIADGQATQYAAGHYLTRHSDGFEGRHFAYVFSFARSWHPDWGGLLQFFEADGTPRDAWLPAFNSLSIFDVTHVHSVTYVAPFAGAMRNSVTGWFRSQA